MKLFKSIEQLTEDQHFSQGIALCIGNFDGVHLGHQAVIRELLLQSLPSVVMIFEPHPSEFFAKQNHHMQSKARLMSLDDKLIALAQSGVDGVLCLEFNEAFARQSADDFITLLIDKLKVKFLSIGDDFRFGNNRSGDFKLLQQSFAGIAKVKQHLSFCLDGERVSSTKIRQLLEQGDFEQTRRYLGKDYQITAEVVSGKQLGRTLGFPTANLTLSHRSPLKGVYQVQIELSGQIFDGICNIGHRPTVNSDKSVVLEVHLFDFSGDLYGKRLTIRFIDKIRDEIKFNSLDSLTKQIAQDIYNLKQRIKKCIK